MSKIKHDHIIEVTIRTRKKFDPTDLAGAAAIQKQLTDAAYKLDGVHTVESRMTKAPVELPKVAEIRPPMAAAK